MEAHAQRPRHEALRDRAEDELVRHGEAHLIRRQEDDRGLRRQVLEQCRRRVDGHAPCHVVLARSWRRYGGGVHDDVRPDLIDERAERSAVGHVDRVAGAQGRKVVLKGREARRRAVQDEIGPRR